jgi:hypothetical protein
VKHSHFRRKRKAPRLWLVPFRPAQEEEVRKAFCFVQNSDDLVTFFTSESRAQNDKVKLLLCNEQFRF